jgi:hypothetical protein
MNYLENGAGQSDDVGVEMKKTNLRGESFYHMVNKNEYNKQFQDLKELLGKPELDKKDRLVYFSSGVEIEKDIYKKLKKIILYNEGQSNDRGESFKVYPHLLPYGMLWTDNPELVKSKLGIPVENRSGLLAFEEALGRMNVYFSGQRMIKVEFVPITSSK